MCEYRFILCGCILLSNALILCCFRPHCQRSVVVCAAPAWRPGAPAGVQDKPCVHDQMVHYCDLLFRCLCVIHLYLSFLCACCCSFSCCAGAAAVGAVSVTVIYATGTRTARTINTVSNGVTVQTRAAANHSDPWLSSSFCLVSHCLHTIRADGVHGMAGRASNTLHATHGDARRRTVLLIAHENEQTRCCALSPSTNEKRTLRGRLVCAVRRWHSLACASCLFVESR